MDLDFFENSNLENFVIFRHGKAERPFDAEDDYSRNLIERGKAEAASQAQRLFEFGFAPDFALVSSANRALQTWEAVKPVFPDTKEEITRELYLASPLVYLKKACAVSAKNVLLIAHDPGLHDLARAFLRGNDETAEAHLLAAGLPTAGVAWFRRDEKIKSGMRLIHHLRPIKSGL